VGDGTLADAGSVQWIVPAMVAAQMFFGEALE
jgi:hypothetical protein